MSDSNTMRRLYKALAAAQAEIKAPAKNRTAKIGEKYKYKYADLADVIACIYAAFPKHGLAVYQQTYLDERSLMIRTVIAHESGATIDSVYPVCSVNGDHKAMGSAMTYARRYALSSLAGVAPDEDTDGEGSANPSAPEKSDDGVLISEASVVEFNELLTELGDGVRQRFCAHHGIDDIAELRLADEPVAWRSLKEVQAKRKKAAEKAAEPA